MTMCVCGVGESHHVIRDGRCPLRIGETFREDLAPMRAVLQASLKVRNGRWVRGAPTHVFAEFLTALDELGWQVIRKFPELPEEVDDVGPHHCEYVAGRCIHCKAEEWKP